MILTKKKFDKIVNDNRKKAISKTMRKKQRHWSKEEMKCLFFEKIWDSEKKEWKRNRDGTYAVKRCDRNRGKPANMTKEIYCTFHHKIMNSKEHQKEVDEHYKKLFG